MDIPACPLCQTRFDKEPFCEFERGVFHIRCLHCGDYRFSDIALDQINQLPQLQKTTLSVFVRERTIRKSKPVTFVFDPAAETRAKPGEFSISIDRVLREHPLPSVPERLDRIILNFSHLCRYPGDRIEIKEKDNMLVYAENVRAALFLLSQLDNQGLIESIPSLPGMTTLTAEGWKRILELQKGAGESRQAFIAMWFHERTDEAYEKGIKPAVIDTGFIPLRIDFKEHNNQITDEIVAEIRRSAFLVADFTGHRQGVYFEAGLMKGIGREVIFTCHKDELASAHFDTRQYAHIDWDNPEDLRARLMRRIQATIPGAK